MLPDIKLEGYQLITLVTNKVIPLGSIIKILDRETLQDIDGELIVKSDGDSYYLAWKHDGSEVGNSMFTEQLFLFSLESLVDLIVPTFSLK